MHVINHDIGANSDADMTVCLQMSFAKKSGSNKSIDRRLKNRKGSNCAKSFRHSYVPLIAGNITM